MGLDIRYVAQARKIADSEDDLPDDFDWMTRDYTSAWPNDEFPGASEGVEEGIYKGETVGHFHAGSYSGYNRWRESLSLAIYGVLPSEIWANRDKWEGKPFVRLINFSDCEGLIGPKACARLAEDFEAHRAVARKAMDDYEFGKYEEWAAAFKAAANSGFVQFH